MKYPLYREARESLELPSGRPVGHFSLENLEAGRLGPEDLGIHDPLARNLERAAEMTRLPAAKILEIYEALRRGERSAELETLAGEIEQAYDAVLTAEFIREAAGLHHPGR
jgi:propanediol dehydratase small subunit